MRISHIGIVVLCSRNFGIWFVRESAKILLLMCTCTCPKGFIQALWIQNRKGGIHWDEMLF